VTEKVLRIGLLVGLGIATSLLIYYAWEGVKRDKAKAGQP
jgi:hypothetical protein